MNKFQTQNNSKPKASPTPASSFSSMKVNDAQKRVEPDKTAAKDSGQADPQLKMKSTPGFAQGSKNDISKKDAMPETGKRHN